MDTFDTTVAAPKRVRVLSCLGAVMALLAVAMGAFGAHGLRERVEPRMLEVFETAARYQMYHALGLFAAAWLAERIGGRLPMIAGWLFLVGIVIFSGSLYALVLTGITRFGMITPIGGVAFMGGWLALAIGVIRRG